MFSQLPPALRTAVDTAQADWHDHEKVGRLWRRDPTLWTSSGEERWLGWLDLVDQERRRVGEHQALAAEVRAAGFTHALLLGMGGSSLCPEVLTQTFGPQAGWPRLVVLDSTDPAQVLAAEHRVDLATTLVIVASKSGSTLEPSILMAYFLERVRTVVGIDRAGSHFMAITDPGSQLEREAREAGFRHIVHGIPAVGGRFSALSVFGLVPAAIMGVDLDAYLDHAAAMASACRRGSAGSTSEPVDPGSDSTNPGVELGLVLGEAARLGRDKLTILTSPALRELGAWLEQLVAESTGKLGKAIIPVDREPLAPAARYGADRVFVTVALAGEPPPQAELTAALVALGHPVVALQVAERLALGGELFRWEVATAVAGAQLGINPFDQPDVEASKIETKVLTSAYERDGALPAEEPFFRDGSIALYADDRNAAELLAALGGQRSLASLLRAHWDRLGPATARGDYAAILAYVEMTDAHRATLERLRELVLLRAGNATCLGFGPRFLHSTGQAYKGGPNTGVFLQVTCDDGRDLAVPGKKATFGVVKAAQARGDLAVLSSRDRRVLRVHLGADVAHDLTRLVTAAELALG
jgi:glucose-6-phosphate isomerase